MQYDQQNKEIRTLNIFNEFEQQVEDKFSTANRGDDRNGELRPEQQEDFQRQYKQDYEDVFDNSTLSEKTKVLIGLAVASAMYSPYCIDQYFNDAIQKGWNREQVKEAIKVAAAIRSGFASVHAIQHMNDSAAE